MAEVFEEASAPLSDRYLDQLLSGRDFWAFAALMGADVVGGITAHTLPMTRTEASEVFIYDIAVHVDHQRRGIGSELVSALRASAATVGIRDVFVPADSDDAHALDFYRRLG
ncbi:MAG TPA: GNAT family N-acetyltransferase, partial [Pseudomonadales bacterium]|nr:GNAT family N-acetyltransferase [Pseudomonadales bacterium]